MIYARRIPLFTLLFLLFVGLCGAETLYTAQFDGTSGRPRGWDVGTADAAFWNLIDGWLQTGDGDNLITATDGYSYAVLEVPGSGAWDDYMVRADFRTLQANGALVVGVRWRDAANHYRTEIVSEAGGHSVRLVRSINGNDTQLAFSSIAASEIGLESEDAALAGALLVSLQGADITVEINGQRVLQATDDALRAGSVALGQRFNNVWFDNLVVESLAPQTVPAVGAAAGLEPGEEIYTVQILSSTDIVAARGLMRSLRDEGYLPFLSERDGRYRVYVGRFATSEEARRMRMVMMSEGFSHAKVADIISSDETVAETAPGQEGDQKIPAALFEDADWESLTPEQQERVMQVVMMNRARRMELQSVQEIMDMKQMIDSMSEKQVSIINRLDEEQARREEIRIQTRQLVASIDRAIAAQNWDEASQYVDDLREINPDSPLVGIKSRVIELRREGRFEGDEVLRANLQKEIAELKVQAQELERQGDLVGARELWRMIIAKEPTNEQNVAEAKSRISRLNNQISAQDRQDRQEIVDEQNKNLQFYVMIMGGVLLALVALLVVIYLAGRRRYARMLQQMQEEAIAPLQQLRQQGGSLGGGAAQAGLAFGEEQNLLEQTEASDADFMVPEREEKPTEQPEEDTGEEAPSFEDTLSTDSSEDFSGGDLGAEDFMMESGPGASAKPEAQAAPSEPESGEEDLVFSFDEGPAPGTEEPTGSAVTAAEIEEPEEEQSSGDLVFSFDDLGEGEETPDESTSVETESPSETEETSDDDQSVYDSVPLGDLDLDLDLGDDSTGAEATASEATLDMESPGGGDLDLDLGDLDLGDDEETASMSMPAAGAPEQPEASEAPESQQAPSGDELVRQDFSNDEVGAMPSGWGGEEVAYANLTVAEDPVGTGGKCLKFEKTSGDGATSFVSKFGEVTGRIVVDFDLRCDEKNKHLLGLYVEADADFRRSVHTVVQFTDPEKPAHLRVFTVATPYQMANWAHVRYVIDLDEGQVDGYVEGELIAEGIRMGTKTPMLNTFSIRDNSETVGVLYLKNLVISRAPDNA